MNTGWSSGIIKCLECGAENRLPRQFAPQQKLFCARCGEALFLRKPQSLQRTWAFVLAGFILYPAANVFPVMTLTLKGDVQHLTVWGGVMELYDSGMAPVALLVFCASILVPFAKLAVLFYLCLMAGSNCFSRRDRTLLYQIVEAIGVWSMVDIFLLSILVALGQLGVLATVEPQIGAVAFAAVVILTLFAAEFFDPRLIWDQKSVNCPRA